MTERHVPDDEAKLETLLRAGLPPQRDPLFRIAVLARLERARFRRQIATMVAVSAATLLVAVNAAAISAWLAEDITRLGGVFFGAAIVVWTFPGGSRVVPTSLRNLARTLSARVTQTVARSFIGSD